MFSLSDNLSGDDVKSALLQPYNLGGTTLSMFVAYIPVKDVNTLESLISNPDSRYYTELTGIPGQLANLTYTNFPVRYAGIPGLSSSGPNKTTIIIAVVVSVLGVVAISGTIWLYIRMSRTRKRRESIRQTLRARYTAGYSSIRLSQDEMSETQPSIIDISPGNGLIRRDSFYYARDSLRYHNPFADNPFADSLSSPSSPSSPGSPTSPHQARVAPSHERRISR